MGISNLHTIELVLTKYYNETSCDFIVIPKKGETGTTNRITLKLNIPLSFYKYLNFTFN